MMNTSPYLLRLSTAVLAALGLGLAGCAETDVADPTPGHVSNTEDATAVDETVEVTLVDFGFEGLPQSVPAGSRLSVANGAEEELHELVAFHLPDDEERSVAALSELTPGELAQELGEPIAVLLAEPGGEQIPAVGDGTLTEPGRYAIMCFIPTGVEPQEYLRVAGETEEGPPQVDGGPPHFVHGMYTELTVE